MHISIFDDALVCRDFHISTRFERQTESNTPQLSSSNIGRELAAFIDIGLQNIGLSTGGT